MPDPIAQQGVTEALQNQKIKRLSERVANRQKMLENDPSRKDFEDRAIEVIRWIRWDQIKWLQDHGYSGEKPGQYCHTSKPFTDALNSADGFVGNAFGEDDWVAVHLSNEQLDQKNELQKGLQQLSRWLVNHYRYGTWMMIQPPIVLDSLTFGDALTRTLAKDREIHHLRCNILNAYLKRGFDIFLSQTHYLEPYMAGEAYEIWGNKLSPATCRAAVENPTQRVWIMRCVYRASDLIFNDVPIMMDKEWTHYEVLIEKDSPKNGSTYESDDPLCGILEHAGYTENPFTDCPYWLPDSEDAYGWSAYGTALISIKRLHASYKGLTNAVQQATDPAMKTMMEYRNNGHIDLRPGHLSYLSRPEDILEEVYKRGIQYPLAIEFLERMEAELESVLHLDLYQAMTLRSKEMTVPEVLEVIGEKARQLMPRIGTRQYLYDNPIHNRTLALAAAMGEGPIKGWQADIDGKPMSIRELLKQFRMVYRGPLAQANEMVMLSRKVQMATGLLQQLASLGDKAMADVGIAAKWDVLAENILDRSDLSQDAITTEDERKQLRQQQADAVELQMAQMMAQAGKTAAEGDKAMAQTQNEGSQR